MVFVKFEFFFFMPPQGGNLLNTFRVMCNLVVMVKKRAAVFYRSIKTRGVAKSFYSDKTRAASFLNGFKNIPQKACLLGFQTKVRIVRGKY